MQIIKIGTNCFFNGNQINEHLMRKKAEEIMQLEDVAIVASGAIKLGKIAEGVVKQNNELSCLELQGFASVGQRLLMNHYANLFGYNVAQLLLTENALKYENDIRELISENLSKGRITIINYNDGIDFEGIKKDNDTLAAQIAISCKADRLIILGRYDGFFDERGNLIEVVNEINGATYSLCNGKSEDGNGGFKTKIDAAKLMMSAGIEMIVGNVNHSVIDVIEGKVKRTIFQRQSSVRGADTNIYKT